MFNEKSKQQQFAMPQVQVGATAAAAAAAIPARPRTVSSPIPVQSPGSSRPLSPGLHYGSPAFSPPSPMRCGTATMPVMPHSMPSSFLPSTSPPIFSHIPPGLKPSPDKFVKPAPPIHHSKKRNSFPGPK